jgi:hypothetical protein
MIRWLRITAIGTLILAMIGLGVGVGLFLVVNGGWVAVKVPPWLTGLFGDPNLELWLPALIAGWLVSIIGVAALLLWSLFYVWRRRQYESLIARLERELARLRNLPFTDPAPLEDLPEAPDARAAAVLAAAGDDDGDEDVAGGY